MHKDFSLTLDEYEDIWPSLDAVFDNIIDGAIEPLRQLSTLPHVRSGTDGTALIPSIVLGQERQLLGENNAASVPTQTKTQSVLRMTRSGVVKEFDRIFTDDCEVLRCNILEPSPNTGNSNLQLILLLKNRYGVDLQTYGQRALSGKRKPSTEPAVVAIRNGSDASLSQSQVASMVSNEDVTSSLTSTSPLQSSLQSQYGLRANLSSSPVASGRTAVALQIKTIFLVDEFYLLILKVLIPTNASIRDIPEEGFVHVAAPLHCIDVSMESRDRRLLRVLMKSPDSQNNMQRLGRSGNSSSSVNVGATMSSTGYTPSPSASSYTNNSTNNSSFRYNSPNNAAGYEKEKLSSAVMTSRLAALKAGGFGLSGSFDTSVSGSLQSRPESRCESRDSFSDAASTLDTSGWSTGSGPQRVQGRVQPQCPSQLHARTKSQLWTLTLQFENEPACSRAVQHIEERRKILRKERCKYMQSMFETWTKMDSGDSDPEDGFMEEWARGRGSDN